jgi:hypothetical protein
MFYFSKWIPGPAYTQGERLKQEYDYQERGLLGSCYKLSTTLAMFNSGWTVLFTLLFHVWDKVWSRWAEESVYMENVYASELYHYLLVFDA